WMDPGGETTASGASSNHQAVSRADGEASFELLSLASGRAFGLRDSAFQPGNWGGVDSGVPGDAVRHSDYRPGGFPAALLDRADERAVRDLRNRTRGSASARDGERGKSHFCDLRHDLAPGLLC